MLRVGFLRRREFRGTCVRGPLPRAFAVDAVCGSLATLLLPASATLPPPHPFAESMVGAGTRSGDRCGPGMVSCFYLLIFMYATWSPESGVVREDGSTGKTRCVCLSQYTWTKEFRLTHFEL